MDDCGGAGGTIGMELAVHAPADGCAPLAGASSATVV
jgi:hypothetical protein